MNEGPGLIGGVSVRLPGSLGSCFFSYGVSNLYLIQMEESMEDPIGMLLISFLFFFNMSIQK